VATVPSQRRGTVAFKYDPFGRRIYKSSSSGASIYAYHGDNLTEETNSSGAVVARDAQTEDIDEPLAILRSSATSYYEADALGSVTSLSNGAGALAQTYSFDSFGNQTASSGSLTNTLRYTGREFDTKTNLYFYRARYYDQSAGRFLSEDPARFSESTNFYPYVGSNPLTYKDPFGQGIVDCAAELARLAYLEAKKAGRLAEQAAASCKDKNHQKSIDQLQNAIDAQRARVIRDCSDADTKKQLLLMGAIVLAIALAPETGGGSLVPALASVF
jgi:RHS repeat-associated protein